MDIVKKLFKESRENNEKFLNRIKNGRVDITGIPTSSTNFPLFEEVNSGNHLYKREAMKTILTTSKLQDIFFSKYNIDNLQKILKHQVWLQSRKKHLIGKQSDQQLKIIMRSVYLQYGKNRKNNIVEQIKELNQIVANYAVPNILSNLELYLGFKKDVSTISDPIPLPKNMSSKGQKNLPNF